MLATCRCNVLQYNYTSNNREAVYCCVKLWNSVYIIIFAMSELPKTIFFFYEMKYCHCCVNNVALNLPYNNIYKILLLFFRISVII